MPREDAKRVWLKHGPPCPFGSYEVKFLGGTIVAKRLRFAATQETNRRGCELLSEEHVHYCRFIMGVDHDAAKLGIQASDAQKCNPGVLMHRDLC